MSTRSAVVTYWLARIWVLRLTALIYFVAFLSFTLQAEALFGSRGVLSIEDFLQQVRAMGHSPWAFPSLFWLNSSDTALVLVGWSGVGLSLIALFLLPVSVVYLFLWFLYLSVVTTGQVFYAYGWESLLLETGFLAVFLAPCATRSLFSPSAPPSPLLIGCLRFLLFRLLLGAGFIKLRSGDRCWWDLTCLQVHFETQPIPNPLSWVFHNLPGFLLEFGVLVNHFVELVVPWFIFGPRRMCHFAGACSIIFQLALILSGNFSWFNHLTIAISFSCFDDSFLGRFAASKTRDEIAELGVGVRAAIRRFVDGGYTMFVSVLSVPILLNFLSPKQVMNRAFEPFHFVNAYGAFGVVGKERKEVILEGTTDEVITERTQWMPYEFRCKPGDPRRHPCVIAPFQPRIDWQIWFSAMSRFESERWLQRLVLKLLEGEETVLTLLKTTLFRTVRRGTFVGNITFIASSDLMSTRRRGGVEVGCRLTSLLFGSLRSRTLFLSFTRSGNF